MQNETMEKQMESKIIVAVRIKPLNEVEQYKGEESIIHCPDQHNLLVGEERAFTFDVVLGPESSQHDVFEDTGMKRLIDLAIIGYSCTVFAFGQTGSGKTYTITGPHSLFLGRKQDSKLQGLMQRAISYLLDQVHTSDQVHLCTSYLEIYNERVRDLLNPWAPYSLAVRGSVTQGFHVENLSRVEFCNLEGFMRLLEAGIQKRETSSNSQNENSSRSHSILTVYIKNTTEEYLTTQGKLCIVDLAGSERVKTGSVADESEDAHSLEETGSINRCLLTLGKCISALADPRKKGGHVPFRDSKLTKLLSDSLGGAGITLMIACVSQTAVNHQETMNTLRYSCKAKKIKNIPIAKHQDLHQNLVRTLQREIRLLRQENLVLRQQLSIKGSPADTRPCGSGSSEPFGSRSDSGYSEDSLRSLLQELILENDKLQRDKMVLLGGQESFNQQREQLYEENSRLLRKLGDLERVVCSSPHTESSYSELSMNDGGFIGTTFCCAHQPHLSVTQSSAPCLPHAEAHVHGLHTVWAPGISGRNSEVVLDNRGCCEDELDNRGCCEDELENRGCCEDELDNRGSYESGTEAGQHHRRKSQADTGYARRFQELRAAQARKVQASRAATQRLSVSTPADPSLTEINSHSHNSP